MTTIRITRAQLRTIIKEEFRRVSGEKIAKQQMNEGVLDTIRGFLGSAGDAVVDNIKYQACEAILERFGVGRDNFFGQVICNAFENLRMEEISGLISGDDNICQTLARNLVEALSEALMEKLSNDVFNLEEDSFLNVALARPVREMLENALLNNTGLSQRIAQGICELNFSQIFSAADVPAELSSGISGLLGGGGASSGAAPAAGAAPAPAPAA